MGLLIRSSDAVHLVLARPAAAIGWFNGVVLVFGWDPPMGCHDIGHHHFGVALENLWPRGQVGVQHQFAHQWCLLRSELSHQVMAVCQSGQNRPVSLQDPG